MFSVGYTHKNSLPKRSVRSRTISDYSPFGVLLPERSLNTGDFRYGYNGMEGDPELKGRGNSYTTEFRQYDPRIGRWWSIDPKTHHAYSPYSAFDNNPVYYVDPEGADSEGENKDDLNGNVSVDTAPKVAQSLVSKALVPDPGKETLKSLKIEGKTLEAQLDVLTSDKMESGDYLEGNDVNIFNPNASVGIEKITKVSSTKFKIGRTYLGMAEISKDASLTIQKGTGEVLNKVDDKWVREKVSGYWIYLNGAKIDGETKVFVNGDKIYRITDNKLSFFKNAKKE